jgi:hypothetical protein
MTGGHFGLCPVCHKTDGYVNVGSAQWFYCQEHKKKWHAGHNLFSGWRDQSEEDQRRIYDEIGVGDFEQIREDGPVLFNITEEYRDYLLAKYPDEPKGAA